MNDIALVTSQQLKKIMPLSKNIGNYVFYLNEAMQKHEINTPVRKAMFVAQIAHESGQLNYSREIGSGDKYSKRKDLGNCDPKAIAIAKKLGRSVGDCYKGRGLIQLTGYSNYLKYSEYSNVDFVNNPDLLEKPEHAANSAAWFWDSRGLNRMADKNQFALITKAINGGINGLQSRTEFYMVAKKVFGVV